MKNLKVDFTKSGVTEDEIMSYQEKVKEIYQDFLKKKDNEKEMLGFLELPIHYDKEELEKIKICARKIQKDSDVLLVIGIGGSYLPSRAVIDALNKNFDDDRQRKYPLILYAGNNISQTYLLDLIEFISSKDFSINVISKSGTTLEPAIAFRIFRELLLKKYGEDEASKRIYVTTDKEKGLLKKMACEKGYESFMIPNHLGGRYSVFSAVGLLPMAVSGIEIEKLLSGAKAGYEKYFHEYLKDNACYQYAVVRNIMYQRNKKIELLATYEPKLFYLQEWWKQLFAESEGKDFKGIFPTSSIFTTDLHSLGQYIQEGERILFETVIEIDENKNPFYLKESRENLDELNYLTKKSLFEITKKIQEGVENAHFQGGVPNIKITLEKLEEENIGELLYFFELSCAMSAMILGVNPFNQPGVEVYKKNMFELLEKPSY